METLSSKKAVIKAIENETVFQSEVTNGMPARNGEPAYVMVKVPLVLDQQSSPNCIGIIRSGELDIDREHLNIQNIIGTKISFIVKAVDDEKNQLICSRKAAQRKARIAFYESAKADQNREYDGRITGFTDFGAFVDVDGVSGMLRNVDYSSDYSRVDQHYNVGDTIKVQCKNVSNDEKRRISWGVKEKYERTEPFVCNLTEGTVMLATVLSIKNFEQSIGVFVRLADGQRLDVLCPLPPEMELTKGTSVVVRISRVVPNSNNPCRPPNLRGTIMRVVV